MLRSQSGALAGVKSNLLLAVLVSLAVLTASQAANTTPAAAAETTISEGRLLWGVKESWRKYIALGTEAGGGATITGWAPDEKGDPLYAEGFDFPVTSGSFDDETNTTKLRFAGFVHFKAYCDTEPPHRCLLDTKYSDLELEIGPETQILRGTHVGYSREDPGGELHVDEDAVIAKYDIAAATTDFAGGVSRWTAIPTVAGPGNGLYTESIVLDSTSFEYTGPGGAPDLSEKWDTPGAPGLVSGSVWLSDLGSTARVLHPSEQEPIVHTAELVAAGSPDARLVFAPLDAATLEPAGTPYTWTFPGALENDWQSLRTAFDPATDSVFFATYNEGPGHDETTVRRAVWNGSTEGYDVETVAELGPFPINHRVAAMVWNPLANELAVIANAGSASDGIYATSSLHRFRFENGSWTDQAALLRLPDTGEWAGAEAVFSPFENALFGEDAEPLAVARDGSYVYAPGTGRAIVGGATHYYPALHIAVAGDGSAAVSPIAGTTTPRTSFGTYYGFSSLAAAPDGSLLLHNSNQVMDGYARIDVTGGTAARVGEIVDAPLDAFPPFELSAFANSMAADPGHGIAWATDPFSPDGSRLHALRGDAIIGSYGYTDFPQSGSKGAYARLGVAPDGDVYLPIQDSGSGRLGYRHLDFTGFVPELTAQPQDQTVVLGPGEASEAVQFSVALADPGGAIQWQAKSPGASAFADLPGATAATLAVEAKPASDGTVYRAVVSNAAGRIASAKADLEVDYAPAVVSDLASREAIEGGEALFVLSVDGNPEPQVQWQRRVGGFWQPIAVDDENFVVNGTALTVRETNLEQSGTWFRAKLSNSAGSVYSKEARLTVNPRTTIPPQGLDLDRVSLDWTGNPEMQAAPPFGSSNYFSAGVSAGNEATYSAAAGNVRVFQVAPGGGEALATWATRGSHVLSGDQLVRLYGGSGRVEADGSAAVAWSGAFSVNFYNGLVPFTFVDPELEVDADGVGTLSADLVGCASSMANPGKCDAMPPVADVTVATFSGVEVDPSGAVEIEPDYAGVEVTAPAGMAAQNRSVAGWGAWPQQFVDFHGQTGLAPYWYSSGGSADPLKRPNPFLVDFEGEVLPSVPPAGPGPGGDGGGGGAGGAGDSGSGGPGSTTPPPAAPTLRGRPVGEDGIARVAELTCRSEGCAVKAPKRVRVKIAGKRFWAKVIAPKVLGKGQKRPLRVKLPKAALSRLNGRTATVRVKVRVLSGKRSKVRVLEARIRFAPGAKDGSAAKGGGGSVAATGIKSTPITSPEPPTLARPATAVDVASVKVTWFPRDSWVRYASSGVGPNDGVRIGGGATALESKSSPCPDRESSSDALLAYGAEFAPKASWYDPLSGSAGIYGQGSVSFRWAAHTIDLTASDPEIEIAGTASRAVFRFSGSGGTPYPNQRAALVSLDTAGRPTVSNGGKTFTYSLMRGTLTAEGVNVFAGFYTPPDNDEFGCVSVEFTTP